MLCVSQKMPAFVVSNYDLDKELDLICKQISVIEAAGVEAAV